MAWDGWWISLNMGNILIGVVIIECRYYNVSRKYRYSIIAFAEVFFCGRWVYEKEEKGFCILQVYGV